MRKRADGVVLVQVAVRLPEGLVKLLDEAALKDAADRKPLRAPSRARVLTRVLGEALGSDEQERPQVGK